MDRYVCVCVSARKGKESERVFLCIESLPLLQSAHLSLSLSLSFFSYPPIYALRPEMVNRWTQRNYDGRFTAEPDFVQADPRVQFQQQQQEVCMLVSCLCLYVCLFT